MAKYSDGPSPQSVTQLLDDRWAARQAADRAHASSDPELAAAWELAGQMTERRLRNLPADPIAADYLAELVSDYSADTLVSDPPVADWLT